MAPTDRRGTCARGVRRNGQTMLRRVSAGAGGGAVVRGHARRDEGRVGVASRQACDRELDAALEADASKMGRRR